MTIQPVEITLIETSPANAWQPAEKNEWADRSELLDEFLRRVRPALFGEKYGRVMVRDPQGGYLDNVKLSRHLDGYRCGSCPACGGWPKRPCEKKPPRFFITVEVDWYRRAIEAEAQLTALQAAQARLQVAAYARGVQDAAAGVEAAADRHPALMNPDTMRHIAANVPLWADHQRLLRAEPPAAARPALRARLRELKAAAQYLADARTLLAAALACAEPEDQEPPTK